MIETTVIGIYILIGSIFLTISLLDEYVPKTLANVVLFTLLSIIWPVPVIIYYVTGKK